MQLSIFNREQLCWNSKQISLTRAKGLLCFLVLILSVSTRINILLQNRSLTCQHPNQNKPLWFRIDRIDLCLIVTTMLFKDRGRKDILWSRKFNKIERTSICLLDFIYFSIRILSLLKILLIKDDLRLRRFSIMQRSCCVNKPYPTH